ncbi:Uncharacterized protein YcnI [Promicromonospora umidemergens]|uniref:YncI copper-binding domain-containing protein n=1 Tax=Promicromonospora umidemergens TaxID=629679 RepID=A0ABP8X766_9MICO|nr:DUF1775 domain-containing protein [Promicromonospora umidemergens]MCP2281169.1 Uncharacterized protein YcnI [Promicromonospora umidemergens]
MLSRTRRHTVRLIAIAASAAGAALLLAGPAQAHVQVIADVIPGEPAQLRFQVPSELATATTVRIAVAVPPELEVMSVPALDGWTQETVAAPEDQGTQVIWTADSGHEIQPGESETFPVRVGPVPDQYSVTFDTEQTYSDGTVSAWNEVPTGDEDPDFPAPVLLINPEAEPPEGTTPAEDAGPAEEAVPAAGPGERPTATAATESTEAAAEQAGPASGVLAGVGAGVVLGGVVTVILLRRRQVGATAASAHRTGVPSEDR